MKRFLSVIAAVAMACFSAISCAEQDYIVNAGDIVKDTDWEKMETITVEMDEFSYNPETITFKAGQAYKLELKNIGEKKHYFTAPEFYKAIATRKVQSNQDGEIKAPYFTAIELMVGGQLDIYFVPVTKGSYPVYCTVKDHRDVEGMEGSLIIE